VEAVSVETILIESVDGHGRVAWRERFKLTESWRKLTIGRSIYADVTLDDPYAAALHASIEVTPDGRVLASDLGSANGLIVGGKRCRDARDLELADNMLQVGRTRLRVRTAHEVLMPERPDPLRPSSILNEPMWVAGIAAVALTLQLIYTSWLGAPRDLAAGIVGALAISVAGIAVWVSFWGLLSRVMQGEWRWVRHAAIILAIAAVCNAIVGMIDLGWFAFALPPWSHRNTWLGAVALGCALFLHLTNASNLTARRAAQIAVILPVLLAGGNEWLQGRSQTRNVNYIGDPVRVYPPSLRLSASETVDGYFTDAGKLREAADNKLANSLAIDAGDDK
jgi:hypothetical protein